MFYHPANPIISIPCCLLPDCRLNLGQVGPTKWQQYLRAMVCTCVYPPLVMVDQQPFYRLVARAEVYQLDIPKLI